MEEKIPFEKLTLEDLNAGIPFDFNGVYAGYYPSCRFTAFTRLSDAWYLAGIDVQGEVHLFQSLFGNVFEERNLIARSPYGTEIRPKSPVVSVLGEEDEGQIYLVCERGQIVILPDCPKCVRIRDTEVPEGAVICGAEISEPDEKSETETGNNRDRMLEICFSDGRCRSMSLGIFRQYRVSWTFAQKLCDAGARLIDVREEEVPSEKGTEHVPFSELSFFLKTVPAGTALIFICRTGRLADEAAEYARGYGFRKAWSAGGTEEWAHIS